MLDRRVFLCPICEDKKEGSEQILASLRSDISRKNAKIREDAVT
jgi:hypothetical protein